MGPHLGLVSPAAIYQVLITHTHPPLKDTHKVATQGLTQHTEQTHVLTSGGKGIAILKKTNPTFDKNNI